MLSTFYILFVWVYYNVFAGPRYTIIYICDLENRESYVESPVEHIIPDLIWWRRSPRPEPSSGRRPQGPTESILQNQVVARKVGADKRGDVRGWRPRYAPQLKIMFVCLLLVGWSVDRSVIISSGHLHTPIGALVLPPTLTTTAFLSFSLFCCCWWLSFLPRSVS